jgi:hypothetical protein
MTQPKSLSRDQVLALRGLRLPSAALKGLQRAGIFCQPAISIVFHQPSQSYVIRGVESGGAVAQIGAYCGFVDGAGLPLETLPLVDALAVNGLHAAVLSPALVRVQMFRVATRYELLLTRHALVPVPGKARPCLQNSVLFHGKHGRLEIGLWGKHQQFRGLAIPIFYGGRGDHITFPEYFHDAVLAVTSGAGCVGCRHNHLRSVGTPLMDWSETNAG